MPDWIAFAVAPLYSRIATASVTTRNSQNARNLREAIYYVN